jgi:hypothetical protein
MKNFRSIILAVFLLTPTLGFCQGMEDAKNKCAELGFTKGTEKFGACVLRLTSIQGIPTASRVNYVIQAPRPVVDNGGIVPVNVTFDPPLMSGSSAKILVNKEIAYEIQVQEGVLSQFNARLILPSNPSTILVDCLGCTGEIYQSEVRLVARLQSMESPPSSMKIVKIQNSVKALVSADSTVSGNFIVSGVGFKVKVLLSKYVVKDPFFAFVGSIGSGQYCGEFVSSGSAKACTEN